MTKKSGMPVMRGILQKKRKGFGFVMVEGKEQDIHIASSRMHDAMNGDLVEIRLLPKRRYSSCPEGEILRIRQRAVTEIAGVLQESGKDGKVVPQDYRIQEEIWIPKRYFAGAKPGDTVVAEVIHYPSRQKGAEGRIIQILRRKGEADGDILALARQRGMTLDFSSTEMAAASHLNRNGLHEEDLHGRMDLRQETIVTIDGADAKDFDDAVSCKKQNGDIGNSVFILPMSAIM